MKKQPGVETNCARFLTVLSVSPLEEDHSSLQAIVGHTGWIVFKARDLVSAMALLRRHRIGVVLCERDCTTATWIDILEQLKHLPHVPSFIVTSRLADEHLWVEALDLGAWDVLAKPFDRNEVIHSVNSGWQHWHNLTQMPATSLKVMRAS